MSVYDDGPLIGYPETYGEFYTGPPVGLLLGVKAELYTGEWTDITPYVYQRNPVTIQLGRQDESSEINPGECAFTLNNRDGRFTTRNPTGAYYGTIGQNTPFRLSVPAYLAGQPTTLLFAGDNQSYVSCPDSASLQLTGNIDCRLDMWLDDYQPCTLAGKWGSSGADQAWCLVLNPDGTVTFWWNDGVSVNSAQSSQPLPYLGRVTIRAFFNASGGQVVFYTAPTMTSSFTQLGSAVTITVADYAQAAAGQTVQVGNVGAFGLPGGCLGRLFEFRLYGAASALVADPQFFNQTAGHTSFNDAQGNTWTLDSTAALDNRNYRFSGEMAAWPKAADPSGHDVYSQAQAAGVMRRLQQGNSPVLSAMRRGIISTIAAANGVVAYWPCEDPKGSGSIASGLPGGVPMRIIGAPSFQGQSGSPSADTLFPCSAQIVQVESSIWYGSVPAYTPGTTTAVFALLAIPSGGLSSDYTLLSADLGIPGNYLGLIYLVAGGGTLEVDVAGAANITGPTGVNGSAMWVRIAWTSGTATLTILDVGGTAETTYTTGTGATGDVIAVVVNNFGGNFSSTEIGQIFVSPDPPDLITYANLLNAWSGETAATRFARLCAENSITSRVYGFPDASVLMGAQAIDTLANLFEDCEATDMGMLYEPREITGVGYRTSASMCNQTPATVADFSQQQVSQGFADTADDLLTINDVTVNAIDGSSYQAVLESGAMSVQDPPDGIGDVSTSVDVYPASDSQLPDLAGWLLHVRSADEDRYPSIPFQMARSTTPQTVPLLRIGDYLQIINTPFWIPPGPVKQLCAGFAESIGPGIIWPVSVNGVPESPYEVMVFGTGATDSSHFDTDGSQLAAGASSTAATLSVATTGPSGILWTTNAADFPFNIMIAGELITVTNITGASSPQTFDVTRSVNGVVKAQLVDAAVNVWPPPVWALA